MRVSVVTPSLNRSSWLKLCLASVADQQAAVEHIVQDAGSTDGTLSWLRADTRVSVAVEKDAGMYDGINRGLRRATGDILAYLNCDEQYLPGCLQRVVAFFESNSDVQVLFGDVVFVGTDGAYLHHRKMQPPLKLHTWTCHLSTLSCGMFFRRSVFFDQGHEFNPGLRDVGDGEWVVRLLRAGVRMAALRSFTSAFTLTGTNMSQGANALRENRQLCRTAPPYARAFRPVIVLHHRLRRWAGGMYASNPFDYAIYTLASPDRRVKFHVANPTPRATREAASL